MSFFTLFFIGRFLLGAAFFVFGVRNVRNVPALAAGLEKKRMPSPLAVAWIGVGMQLVGGLLVAVTPFVVLGGACLFIFVLLAAYLFHPFWEFSGDAQKPHVTAWIMNIGLAGAFLMVMASGF